MENRTPADDAAARPWRILLTAVSRLHDRGHTDVRAVPHLGPVGYWRLLVSPAGNLVGGVGPEVRDVEAACFLTEGSFPMVGDLEMTPGTTVDRVADELWRAMGSPRVGTHHDDEDYLAWYPAFLAEALRADTPPTAFTDWSSGWESGGRPLTPPPGWNRIDH